MGATSAGREKWSSLPPLPFAGETLLPGNVVGRPRSDFSLTGDKRPTETHPEELQPREADSKRPEGESVTEFPETLLPEDPAWNPVHRTGCAFRRRPRKKVVKRKGGSVEASASLKPSVVKRGAPPT